MATPDGVLNIFRSQLGVKESPAGSNKTPYTAWYGLVGPWCAMFVSWCFHEAGLPLAATTPKGFAYTPYGAAWFQRRGRWRTKNPQVGDVVFFDFPGDGVNRISHVGIVEALPGDGSVICIEGNTDAAGGRTGGKVMRKARRSGIVGYGIPDYETAQPAVLPAPDRPPRIVGAEGAKQRPWNPGTWVFAADGGVFAMDGAPFFGSMGGQPMNAPVVDLVPTPTGNGYWLIGADGGIFAFGDAPVRAPYRPLFDEYARQERAIVGGYVEASDFERSRWVLTLWSDALPPSPYRLTS